MESNEGWDRRKEKRGIGLKEEGRKKGKRRWSIIGIDWMGGEKGVRKKEKNTGKVDKDAQMR